MRNKILIVDDDTVLGTALKRFLNESGYVSSLITRGHMLMSSIENDMPDLILLDRKLPDADGLDLMRELGKTHTVPVILITGMDDQMDKVIGLELGADDYITKPFHMKELLARIKAINRRMSSTSDKKEKSDKARETARFMECNYNMVKGVIKKKSGETISLTGAEQRLLNYLITNSNKTVSKETLHNIVSSRTMNSDSRSIEVLISAIRKKLGDGHDKSEIIRTIRGKGYAFIATLELV